MRHRQLFSLALIIPVFATTACSSPFGSSIKSEVKTAMDLIKDKKEDEAQNILEQVCARDPKDTKARMLSATLDEHKKDYEGALQKLTWAIDADPALAEAYSERAVVNTKLGHNDAALADINQATRLEPKVAKHYLRRAMVGITSKDWRLALDSLDQVEKLDAKGNEFWIAAYRGEAYAGLKEYKQAREYFDAAVKVANKGQYVVYLRRANCRARAGDYAGAKEDCMTFLKADPENPHVNAVLGALMFVEGKPAEGKDLYAKAFGKVTPADWADDVDMGAEHADAVTEVVDLYLKKKDADSAAALLTKIESHRPLEPQEQYRLALANFQLKRPERGISLLNATISMAPDYVAPRVELIRYYSGEGLASKAMELQREAYAIAKSPKDKSEIAGAMIKKH